MCHLEALDDHKITPLFLAAEYGQQECLEILVNAGKQLLLCMPCVYVGLEKYINDNNIMIGV